MSTHTVSLPEAPLTIASGLTFGHGWMLPQHPRFLADLTGDGCADIIGFGNHTVYAALNRGDGTFGPEEPVVADFGYTYSPSIQSGWKPEMHPRVLADITGDKRADIIGFGHEGVYVALNHVFGTFQKPELVLEEFGYAQGWRVDEHLRFLADLNGDGRADIVGFALEGVRCALSKGDGSFTMLPSPVLADFGSDKWHLNTHPRFVLDITGNRCADIVGFHDDGVYVALGNGNGTFQPKKKVIDSAYCVKGNWGPNHPRLLADLTGDGLPDIVGFGENGVHVALNRGNGDFDDRGCVLSAFGENSSSRYVTEKHLRFLADVNGDGRSDIVGFWDDGVYVAIANTDGTFQEPELVIKDFGYAAGGWRIEKHPRFVADLNGDGRADILGFGGSSILVRVS